MFTGNFTGQYRDRCLQETLQGSTGIGVYREPDRAVQGIGVYRELDRAVQGISVYSELYRQYRG